MNGAHAIKEAYATFPGGQIQSSPVLLDAHSCLLPYGVARVNR